MCGGENVSSYDLCIVGAGMFGCAAARHASANPALKVCLIGPEEPTEEEFKDRDIFGAHYDEGRLINVSEVCEEYQNLNRESLSRFRELEKLSGIEFYTPSGSLIILDKFHSAMSHLLNKNKAGNPQILDLSSREIFKKRFPYIKLEKNDCAYLDDMGAGYLSPRKMIAAQKKVALLQGCNIISDVVSGVKKPVDGMHLVLTEKYKTVKAKRVLLCPGAFINFKNLYPIRKLKVFLRKETSVLLRILEEEAKVLSSMPTIVTHKDGPNNHPNIVGAYILPPIKYPDGKFYLKIGHLGEIEDSDLETLEQVKTWYNSKGNEDVQNFYSKFLQDLLPELKVEEIHAKSCVTSDSPTGFPYIERITPTVTVAAVGNSRGAATCEEVGRLAAQLSVTGKWDSKLSKSLFEAVYE